MEPSPIAADPDVVDPERVLPSEPIADEPAATAQPTDAAASIDVFDEIDFEVDALEPHADDNTLQLEAAGDVEVLVQSALDDFAVKLDRELTALRGLIERDRRAEETRERVVDRLHAELQQYKEDLDYKNKRPIFLDLIQLHDDLGKRAESLADSPVADLLREYQREIEDILYRQGVEAFEEPGDAFDPKRQRAVRTVATDDPGLNKTIAARIHKGFQSGERLVRPESVSVYTVRKG